MVADVRAGVCVLECVYQPVVCGVCVGDHSNQEHKFLKIFSGIVIFH